jgi:hypothetical protein
MAMDDKVIAILRAQAWERAKGELEAMISTYYGVYTSDGKNVSNGKQVMELVATFVKTIEDECLHEGD